MRFLRTASAVLLLLAALGSLPAYASPDGLTPAARLSAALGGTLDWNLGEAGELDHPIDYRSVTLHPGRSIEYRRRVALERELAAALGGKPGPLIRAFDTPRSSAQ